MPSSHLYRNGSQSKASLPPSVGVRKYENGPRRGNGRGGGSKVFRLAPMLIARTHARGVRSGQVVEGGYLHACWGRRPAGHQGVYYLTTEYPSTEFNYYAPIYVYIYACIRIPQLSPHRINPLPVAFAFAAAQMDVAISLHHRY